MPTLTTKERRNSQRVPVQITVRGELGDCRATMYSENISLDGMFLLSADFIPLRAVFAARIWLSTDEEPLHAYLTSRFLVRTWASYGHGVCLSGISTADKTRWEDFYHCCAEAQAEQRREYPPAAPTTPKRRLVVVAGSLGALALQELRQPGVELWLVESVSEALALAQAQQTDVVVGDLQRPGLAAVALCRSLSQSRLPTRVVLLGDGSAPSDFLLGIHAGAALVIGRQCSPKILASRILAVLEQRIPGGRALPSRGAGELAWG